MMYCDRCNIDFSEGLRYCKWCGQTLVERRRATSELSACPACNATAQPSWVFCKSCGARLTQNPPGPAAPASKPDEPTRVVTPEAGSTAVIQSCPSCGEKVDQGSVYCKGCGAALYEPQTPFGTSALLCSVCHSYSPIGSTACRVCGALLIETASSIAETQAETLVIKRKESSTLPDLAEHLPDDLPANTAERASHLGKDQIESGAHTLTLTQSELQRAEDKAPAEKSSTEKSSTEKSSAPSAPRPKGGETSVLPGVAGSKFEQPLPTSSLQADRTTGPVESDESENAEFSGAVVETPPSRPAPVTRLDTDSFASHKEKTAAGDSTIQFISQAAQDEHGTIAFSSGAAPPPAFKDEDKTSAFHFDEEAPREHVITDQFATPAPPAEMRTAGSADSRAFSGGTNRIEPFNKTVAEPVARTDNSFAPSQHEAPPAFAPPVKAENKGEGKKSSATIIAVIASLVVLGVAAFSLWWYLAGGKSVKPTQPPVAQTETPSQSTAPAQPAAPPSPPPAPVVPEGMVTVPAGAYTIGRNDESDLEKPERTVNLPAFFIDRTEVTNADYKKFVDQTNHKPPSNWTGGAYPSERASYPVTGISWQDADAFARWAGKRLPTEAEWEAAARGSDARRYPWGNDWRSSAANIGVKASDKSGDDQYPAQIKPAGQYPEGASTTGALDMIGNVWEFTADEFNLYPGNPQSLDQIKAKLKLAIEPGKNYRIIRGGAFDGDKRHDASYRGWVDASLSYPKTGFRCAKDAK